MPKKKRKIIIGEFEQRILVKALVEFRNQLLGDGKPTEDINELILKVIDAPNTDGGGNYGKVHLQQAK